MQSPILPILALLPLAAAILLLFLPAAKRNLIRGIALGTSIVTLILSVIVFLLTIQQLLDTSLTLNLIGSPRWVLVSTWVWMGSAPRWS